MTKQRKEFSCAESAEEKTDIFTEEQLVEVYGKADQEDKEMTTQAIRKLKNIASCKGKRAHKILHSVLPITGWLPRYKLKQHLLGDIIGGITVGIVHLPQGMAYGLLAGLPPINGLYVSFFPVLMYAIFGTTHHLSVGTFAVISLMIGAVIDKNAPSSCSQLSPALSASILPFSGDGIGTTFPTSVGTAPPSCDDALTKRKIEIAIGLSVAVAIIHFAMYFLRLGIITIYLSSHMISGYTCGAAFHVLTSQISKLLGQNIPRKSGVLSLIYTYVDIFSSLNTINWATVIISVCCIVFLVIGKEINARYKEKLPFPLPWELVLVIASTTASQFGKLDVIYDVDVVGEIPQGIRTSVPAATDIGLVFTDAIPIAIVIFSVSVSLSRLFSEKHAYEFDANQELLAYAVANTFGAFFQCFPSASSLSRSLIWDETGGKTQLTGIISSVIILVILLWMGPLFEKLPQAALAAIIVVNLKRLLKQFNQLKPLWKVSKIDSVIWLVSWLSVVLLGVDYGLYVGVAFSLFSVVLRTQIVSGNVLVPVGNTGQYRSSKRFVGNSKENVLVFKFAAPLIYANQERFKNQFNEALGFKPSIEFAKRQKLEKALRTQKEAIKLQTLGDSNINMAFTFENKKAEQSNGVIALSRNGSKNAADLPEDFYPRQKKNEDISDTESDISVEEKQPAPTRIILDMSSCPFIDNDGVKALKTLQDDLNKLQIHLMLVRCTSDVRSCLAAGKLSSKSSDGVPVFFVSMKKAVSYKHDNVAENTENLTDRTTNNKSSEGNHFADANTYL